MNDAELEALGLHYEFIPIDYYLLGEETTSETAHFEQIGDKTSGVFAQFADADGKTIKGQTATKEAVEREPLVRVNLVDGEGNIVLYGYIKGCAKNMKIIVDAFPGDNALLEILKACAEAVTDFDIDILLTGDQDEIRRVAKEKQYFIKSYGNCSCSRCHYHGR